MQGAEQLSHLREETCSLDNLRTTFLIVPVYTSRMALIAHLRQGPRVPLK